MNETGNALVTIAVTVVYLALLVGAVLTVAGLVLRYRRRPM